MQAGAPVLTVTSFNANGVRRGDGGAFDELVVHGGPHVFALQELPFRDSERKGPGKVAIVARLERAGITPALPGGAPADEQYASVGEHVFSRLPAAGPARVLTGDSSEGLWEWGGVTRAEYEWQGSRIAVYSVHLHSFDEKRPWRRQWGQGSQSPSFPLCVVRRPTCIRLRLQNSGRAGPRATTMA